MANVARVAVKAAAKTAVMVNAEKVAVTAVVGVAVASAAKVRKAKSARRVKGRVVVRDVAKVELRAAMNCARAKPAPHAVSVANAQSVLPVTVLLAKAVAMAEETNATKDATKRSPS